jgi:hypothetical protein
VIPIRFHTRFTNEKLLGLSFALYLTTQFNVGSLKSIQSLVQYALIGLSTLERDSLCLLSFHAALRPGRRGQRLYHWEASVPPVPDHNTFSLADGNLGGDLHSNMERIQVRGDFGKSFI